VQLSCKGWAQEAAKRMLMNNLDAEVAEKPAELIVYGGTGRAARNWECYQNIIRSLETLGNDETLCVQSGKPVGTFPTHEYAPRVLIANSNLVGHWANWEEFRRLEALGLTMYGQMTAGSWIYIGTQGIVQGTFETFAAAGQKHFRSDLAGKLVVSGGMGGMGGAQPLAATMNGASFLGIDVDAARIQRWVRIRYCDRIVQQLDEALDLVLQAKNERRAFSVGLVGNCAEVLPELCDAACSRFANRSDERPRPAKRIHPQGFSLEAAAELRRNNPRLSQHLASIARHVQAMLDLQSSER
jgi:urocanate hydratase